MSRLFWGQPPCKLMKIYVSLLNVKSAEEADNSLEPQIFAHRKDGEITNSKPTALPEQANLLQTVRSNASGISVLGGRPGMGKTSFALQTAVQAAKNGESVIVKLKGRKAVRFAFHPPPTQKASSRMPFVLSMTINLDARLSDKPEFIRLPVVYTSR